MIPIHELINRIRWDPDFARGDFRLGYYDRVDRHIVRVAFRDLIFTPDDHFGFTLIDDEGTVHSVPYHRVREVFRNGALIWRRQHDDTPAH